MQLTIIRQTESRVNCHLTDDEGQIVWKKRLDSYKENDIRFLSNLTEEPITEINKLLSEVCTVTVKGQHQERTIECNPPKHFIESLKFTPTGEREDEVELQFTVTVREIQQPKKYAQEYLADLPHDALREAMNNTCYGDEPLVEWDSKEFLCCLDIDYHHVPLADRPSLAVAKDIVRQIKPLPFCWHPSHSKGAKLYYSCKPGFTAEELASVAGIQWLKIDPRATFDLIKSTRHPLYKRKLDNAPPPCENLDDIQYTYGSGDLSAVRKLLLSEADENDVAELLAERGWKLGQTLPHTDCQINPTEDKKQNVYVGEKGLFCHRCHALGMGPKSSPGFTPYAAMIGGTDNRITTMVKNFCHVDHARIILQTLFPAVPLLTLETVYKIMMKLVHTPDDPRIGLAMVAGRGFIRTIGRWVSNDGETTLAHNQAAFVNSLPAVLIPSSDKGFNINVAKSTALQNTGSLAEYGYPDITFVRGCKIYGQFLQTNTNEITFPVVRKEFQNCPPRYVPKNKRLSDSDMWEIIDGEFPGIDRNYLKLLIAAKGASEGRMAQCPFMLVTGPAGSGKSTTPHIAAGICGDKADEPIWHPHPERFRASLMDASTNSSFVVVNEIFKSAKMNRLDNVQALNPMLSLTEDSRSHVLYLGSVPFGRLPVFILTDVQIPREVESDVQIARRFIYYRLTSRINWEDTLVSRGIRPHQFRLISQDHTLAADCLLSNIIDEFFQERNTLKVIADKLSAKSLETYSEEPERKKSLLKLFYLELINAPALVGSDALRYNPKLGWKRIDRTAGVKLNEYWNEISDGNNDNDWTSSRLADGEDWQQLLGAKFPITVDINPYQKSIIYVRFRDAGNPRNAKWINGSLTESKD